MVEIYRAPDRSYGCTDRAKIKIFLAGSIEMGIAKEWQKQLENDLTALDIDTDLIVFNPRRDDFDPHAKYSADNPYMGEQIEWELEHILMSDIVVFFFASETMSPITLYELGLISQDVYLHRKKAVVFCEEGYLKKANVDVNTQYFDIPTVTNWPSFLNKIVDLIKDSPSIGGKPWKDYEV